MNTVGIDLGYGETKIVGLKNKREKFSSRWAQQDPRNWGLGGNIPVLTVNDGETFTYGENAIGSNVREPLGDNRLSDPDSLPLLGAALWLSDDSNDVKAEVKNIILGSGIQLGSYEIESKKARENLEGNDIIVKDLTGKTKKFHISKLVMRPQGVAAALYLLNQGTLKQQYGYGVIVDIGSRTTEVVTLNLKNMEPIVPMSFSIELGVGDVVSELGKVISKETGFIIPPDVAMDALSQPVFYKQREVGGPEVSQPILDSLTSRILDKLRDNLREELDRVSALIPVGGGAALMGKNLEVLAPSTLISLKPQEAQFANALGYKLAAGTEE
ncbi:ParM/StbA family protein [Ferroplasma sp.]|uniref:ParM/StbA family protein n=1 Tax=Ferroplasma sp. TaxID=2591003 RepID=UPI00307E953F